MSRVQADMNPLNLLIK